MLDGESHHVERPQHVVLDGLAGVELMSGTCLCAAAWNTICGRKREKALDRLARSRTQQITGSTSQLESSSCSSATASNTLFSPRPNTTS